MILRILKRDAVLTTRLLRYLDGGDGLERVLERYFHQTPQDLSLLESYWKQLDLYSPLDEVLYHLTVSFPPGTQVTRPLSEIVPLLLRELGMEQFPAFAVRHADREHDHIHLVLSRLDPETLQPHSISPETLRHVIARLEQLFNQHVELQGFTSKLSPEQTITRRAATYYRQMLERYPTALAYLKKRGISPETARRLGVGYAPRKGGLLQLLSSRERWIEVARRAGLLNEGKHGPYDCFRDRIVLPLTDLDGNLVGLAGRAVGDNPLRYYNQKGTPRKEAFFGIPLEGTVPEKVYLVEGQFDALALHEVGFFGISPAGSALTPEQVQALKKAGVRQVVIVYDNDHAGREGREQAAALLQLGGIATYCVDLPETVKDAAELLQKQGPEALRQALRQERPYHPARQTLDEVRQRLNHRNSPPPPPPQPKKQFSGGGRSLSEISLLEVIGAYTRLEKKGESWRGLCPAHQEKTPSFYVREERGYYCFGCGIRGRSPVTFIMQVERVEKAEALRILQERFGLAPPQKETYHRPNRRRAMDQTKRETFLKAHREAALRKAEEKRIAALTPEKVQLDGTRQGVVCLLHERSWPQLRALLRVVDDENRTVRNAFNEAYQNKDLIDLLEGFERGRLLPGVSQYMHTRIGSLLASLEIERLGLYELMQQVRKDGLPEEMLQDLLGEGYGPRLELLLESARSLMVRDLGVLSLTRDAIERQVYAQFKDELLPYLGGKDERDRAWTFAAIARQLVLLNSEHTIRETAGLPKALAERVLQTLKTHNYDLLLADSEQLERSLSRISFVQQQLHQITQPQRGFERPAVGDGSSRTLALWQRTKGACAKAFRLTGKAVRLTMTTINTARQIEHSIQSRSIL